MNRSPRIEIPLWTLQWSLAIALLVGGLLRGGLDEAELSALPVAGPALRDAAPSWAGWVLVAGAVLLVVPSATGFGPWATPLTAAFLASFLGASALDADTRLPASAASAVAAAACALVAMGRSLLARVPPIRLGEEEPTRDQPSLTPHAYGALRQSRVHP